MKKIRVVLAGVALAMLAALAHADLAQTGEEVKDATVHAAKKTGEAAREVGHATASAAKSVGHSVAKAARKGYHATKRLIKKPSASGS